VVVFKNHDRIFEIAFLLQIFQDLTNFLIDHRDVGEVVGTLPVALRIRRIDGLKDRVVIDFGIVEAFQLKRFRLGISVA
jgi:hypothetical protein